MINKEHLKNEDCPVRNILDRLGDKWSVLIILELENGKKRFTELKQNINDISQRMLTHNLRLLERDGLIKRKVYPVIPPRVEYSLLELGNSFLLQIKDLVSWADKHMLTIENNRKQYDKN